MTDPLATYTLAEIREALEAAARLTERVRKLEDDVWMNAEDAARFLGWKSAAALAKTDAPRKHASPRVILYNRGELKRWVESKPDG
jgi:hypothetical protein